MIKILVFTAFNQAQQQKLKSGIPIGTQLIFNTDLSTEELPTAFDTAEIILGNPPANLFNAAPSQLKFWQIDSAGFDQYQELNLAIPVANMGAYFALGCAETIVGGILCFYRQLHQLVRLQTEKKWEGKEIRTRLQGLTHKKVLILGTGAIGLAVKKLLIGFDCQISTTARKNPLADLHNFKEILAVLPDIDVVINTLPGTATNYVSANFFEAMKPGSLYSNVGRGNTTVEKALLSALETGKIAGAVLDVTATEPLPKNNKLWRMENVILTQHTGGGDGNEAEAKLKQLISNVNNFIKGKPINNLINLAEGY
ncbi:glyoxylate/hydroxypyruvate reductase A [Pedobacter sp. CG_S7]|uniref:D-2-hydroxyacid dehydrogenase n=1 Tax=Pedobacter sp. CG_S7 TaxID=3143930 RepID=UPI0033965B88